MNILQLESLFFIKYYQLIYFKLTSFYIVEKYESSVCVHGVRRKGGESESE